MPIVLLAEQPLQDILERVELVNGKMCLSQDAAEGPGRHFAVPRCDGREDAFRKALDELDVAALLRGFDEPRCLQLANDLAIG